MVSRSFSKRFDSFSTLFSPRFFFFCLVNATGFFNYPTFLLLMPCLSFHNSGFTFIIFFDSLFRFFAFFCNSRLRHKRHYVCRSRMLCFVLCIKKKKKKRFAKMFFLCRQKRNFPLYASAQPIVAPIIFFFYSFVLFLFYYHTIANLLLLKS